MLPSHFHSAMYGIRVLSLAVALAALSQLSACAGYVLHGKAVRASYSHITLTESTTAANIADAGVGGVRIAVYRDAGRLSQKLIATGRTEPDGSFAIPIPSFGAGWMEEEWLVQATREGYESAEGVFAFPLNSRKKPVLIRLTPGRSLPFEQRDDFKRDYERFQ